MPCADEPAGKHLIKRNRTESPAEAVEARLERKAAVSDARTSATVSLGQMRREQRHTLLYSR
jgi:hypothetical protein